MEARLNNTQQSRFSARSEADFINEKRIGQLLSKLERKLEEDSASSLNYDDIAFQLTDLRMQVEEIAKEKSRSENVYYWLILFVSFVTLGMVSYLSSYVVLNALSI